jgi:maltose alpha-D-glucosyltransferase/alpha-amylase
MQWTAERHGGFSRAEKVVRPVIGDDVFGYERVNVAAQRWDVNSLLNWTERRIRMRQECPEIGWGDYSIVETNAPEVLALRYDWRGTMLVTLHNFSSQPRELKLKLVGSNNQRLVNVFQDESFEVHDGAHDIRLDGYGYKWLRVGAVDTTLDRTPF